MNKSNAKIWWFLAGLGHRCPGSSGRGWSDQSHPQGTPLVDLFLGLKTPQILSRKQFVNNYSNEWILIDNKNKMFMTFHDWVSFRLGKNNLKSQSTTRAPCTSSGEAPFWTWSAPKTGHSEANPMVRICVFFVLETPSRYCGTVGAKQSIS